ncbi:MAG TPA: hypothetical protein EYO98_05200, partial [Candidatus Poseidoniales archaeon]|nr:hypothetical protein [Candidatus Poseidoniales archaeon]
MGIEKIAVLGAGQMGNGIAQVAACAGYSVVMIDIKQEYVEAGLAAIEKSLARLVAKERMTQTDADEALALVSVSTEKSAAADADLVVEAIPEIPELKFSVFAELDAICKPEAILASNTSSISINEIAAATNRPDKVIGMHFMNPVAIMRLVEIINGSETSEAVTAAVVEASERMGKTALACNDSPGFVSNRILCPMINEVLAHSDAAPGDWIELYNTTSEEIDLGGWFLSDDNVDLTKFQIPPNTILPGGGHLVFNQRDHFGHLNNPRARIPFGLSELGDEVIL